MTSSGSKRRQAHIQPPNGKPNTTWINANRLTSLRAIAARLFLAATFIFAPGCQKASAQTTDAPDNATVTVTEREKFEAEQRMKQAELAIKEREIAIKEAEMREASGFLRKLGPVGLGLFVAAIGLFGNLITTMLQGIHQRRIEQRKSEAMLIVELAKGDNLKRVRKNIQWFLQAGLISDPKEKLRKALESETEVPLIVQYPPAEGLLQSIEDLMDKPLLTPEEQGEVEKIEDPVKRAGYVLDKIVNNMVESGTFTPDELKKLEGLTSPADRYQFVVNVNRKRKAFWDAVSKKQGHTSEYFKF